jgi:cob(I)alamin adenosyltransferase
MSIKIYTKTGDKGKTSLLGGTKISKSDIRIEAYGTVDELNAWVGLCHDLLAGYEIESILLTIQDRLFTMGSKLACDPDKQIKMALPSLAESDCVELEREIDRMDGQLPAMKSFVLPGGHVAVSNLHIARCVCRRAERACIRLMESSVNDEIVIKYLNRLSDYLFVLARYAAFKLRVTEVKWQPRSGH